MLLPLLALVLAAGGALWLTTTPAPARSGDVGYGEGHAARARLIDARRALIAHASAYPESYGPLGAGPGHLVCPDTDTPLERSSTPSPARTGRDFGGDGPNPPCGGGSLAVGRLPRHASPDGRRRAFHHEPSQRFVYGVTTGHVNNPPGRAVRDASVDGSSESDVVAIVVDPGGVALSSATLAGARDPLELLRLLRSTVAREAGADAARALPHVTVTRGELSAAAERRVAAWFVETATDAARRRGAPASVGVDVARDVPVVWPDASCPDDAAHESLRWIGDIERGADDGCATPASIENAPRERHWFVRQGWFRDVAVRYDGTCRGATSVACRLDVARDAERRRDAATVARTDAGAGTETGERVGTIALELVPRGRALDSR